MNQKFKIGERIRVVFTGLVKNINEMGTIVNHTHRDDDSYTYLIKFNTGEPQPFHSDWIQKLTPIEALVDGLEHIDE